jgi:hypothetical protein
VTEAVLFGVFLPGAFDAFAGADFRGAAFWTATLAATFVAGAAFTAAFLAGAFLAAGSGFAAAALFAAHRFFVAAAIRALAATLKIRFGVAFLATPSADATLRTGLVNRASYRETTCVSTEPIVECVSSLMQ